MIIYNLVKKINSYIKNDKIIDILLIIILILVAVLSYQLGKMSQKGESGNLDIIYSDNVSEVKIKESLIEKNKEIKFFASIKGKKYYSIGCRAGDSINLENRIYFNSEEEAILKGYSKSIAC